MILNEPIVLNFVIVTQQSFQVKVNPSLEEDQVLQEQEDLNQQKLNINTIGN